MLLTRMKTLTFILCELSFLDGQAAISCPPSILNTVTNIFMRLYGSVEEIVTMCHV